MATKTFLALKGDLVLIKPFNPDDEYTQSEGGILIASASAHEKHVRQVVVATGPDVEDPDVYAGVEVCVGKHAGIAVDVGGQEFKIVEHKEILGIYETEEA